MNLEYKKPEAEKSVCLKGKNPKIFLSGLIRGGRTLLSPYLPLYELLRAAGAKEKKPLTIINK